ncbi:MAG: phage holin family protein [bacterium]|nr:phage holin family protein [bacterium]
MSGIGSITSYWALQTIAMMITSGLLPGLKVTSIGGAFGTVLCIALMNATVWDAALFFQIPESLSAQALVLLLANGLFFWIIVKLLPGIEVDGIASALLAPLIYTACSLIISHYGYRIDWYAVMNFVIEKIGELKDYINAVPAQSPSSPD